MPNSDPMDPNGRARKASEDLLAIADAISVVRRDRAEAEQHVADLGRRLAELEQDHLRLVLALTRDAESLSGHDTSEPNAQAFARARSRIAIGPQKAPAAEADDSPDEPLASRVIRCLGSSRGAMTPDQIAAQLNEPEQRVTYTLRDLRAKRKLTEPPKKRQWRLNAAGKSRYEQLAAAPSTKEAPM